MLPAKVKKTETKARSFRFFYVSSPRGFRTFTAENAAVRPAAPMRSEREVLSTFLCRWRGEKTGGRGHMHRFWVEKGGVGCR